MIILCVPISKFFLVGSESILCVPISKFFWSDRRQYMLYANGKYTDNV